MNEDNENQNRNHTKSKRSREPKINGDQDTCVRCGKTPRTTKTATKHKDTPNISLLKPEKQTKIKKCKSRCKHKEKLAKFTNVSITTVDSTTTGSESETSWSTGSTRVTERSVRSLVRETNANNEIARLHEMNTHLSDQLDALSKGTITIQELIAISANGKPSQIIDDTTEAIGETTSQILDNTLTAEEEEEVEEVEKEVTGGSRTPRVLQVEPEYILKTPRSLGKSSRAGSRTELALKSGSLNKINPEINRRHEQQILVTPLKKLPKTSPPNSEHGPDSGYISVKDKHRGSSALEAVNKELLDELEEENRALREELRSSILQTEDLVSLESEIRRLRSDNSRQMCEIGRLKDVETRLYQVEQFYQTEKRTFRNTIEDTLITLEDFRRDKEDLEKEILSLEEKLKDVEQKKGSLREELDERNNLLSNSVEKLKLELNTGQSESAMLQSRITTIEENCSFLEGQVQALERDNLEKVQVIAAAEQHAKDMEKQIATLRKENAVLESEKNKVEPLQNEVEVLKSSLSTIKEEKSSLQSVKDKCDENSSQLEARLTALGKTNSALEEDLQNKSRTITGLKDQVNELSLKLENANSKAKESQSQLSEENERLRTETETISGQLDACQREVQYIEEAFFRGWSDNLEEVDEKSVTFKDEQKSPTKFPKANKIIQSIKLDRQKLKAKLIRSVQDNKTLQSQVHDTRDALDKESAGLAKKLREAVNRAEEGEVKGHVMERTAKNLSLQIEELNVVNKSLEMENYHLKRLSESLSVSPSRISLTQTAI